MILIFTKEKNEMGFALPFVILISFLITSVVLGLVTILYFQNVQIIRRYDKKKLELACFSAIQNTLNANSIKNSKFTFFSHDSIPVEVQTRIKGLFYEITAFATKYNDSSKLYCLAAEELPGYLKDHALIISKPIRNAAYAGNNEIFGNLLSTSASFTPEIITGLRTEGTLLKSGSLIVSNNIREKLYMDSLFLSLKKINDSESAHSHNIYQDLIITQDFISNTNYKSIFVAGNLYLRGHIKRNTTAHALKIFVAGKTIVEEDTQSDADFEVYGDSSFFVGRSSRISNFFGYFKSSVMVEKGNRFDNCQIFSSGNISLEKSNFLYPSIIGLYADASTQSGLNRRLTISSTVINGSVILISSFTGLSLNKSRITLDQNSRLHGLLYSENYTDLKGKVSGLVYTYSFYYYKEPSEYLDWLIDLKINRKELSEAFLAPLGFSYPAKLKILKSQWIY